MPYIITQTYIGSYMYTYPDGSQECCTTLVSVRDLEMHGKPEYDSRACKYHHVSEVPGYPTVAHIQDPTVAEYSGWNQVQGWVVCDEKIRQWLLQHDSQAAFFIPVTVQRFDGSMAENSAYVVMIRTLLNALHLELSRHTKYSKPGSDNIRIRPLHASEGGGVDYYVKDEVIKHHHLWIQQYNQTNIYISDDFYDFIQSEYGKDGDIHMQAVGVVYGDGSVWHPRPGPFGIRHYWQIPAVRTMYEKHPNIMKRAAEKNLI